MIFDKDRIGHRPYLLVAGMQCHTGGSTSGEVCKTAEGREDINWWQKEAQRIALAGVLIMGSVKPSYIKNFAMDLLRTYESSFSPDFEAEQAKGIRVHRHQE